MNNRSLKTNEAAQYLGVSRSSLTNWVKQGLIDGGITPGGHYRFTIDNLNSFAENRGLNISQPQTNNNRENIRILVIEDDAGFREFLTDALDVFSNYELKETEDGMKGALLAGAWKPHLIILDVRMPNMNGIEFLKLLREEQYASEIKVIVASAHLTADLKESLKYLDADIILEKPVRLAQLVASVQKLVDLTLAT